MIRYFVCALLMIHVAPAQWSRHVIDNTSRGADGVRLADFNRDGLPDIATGWEEGGVVRVYRHPGHTKVRQPWPAVTVGKPGSPEDAVLVDLDGDGALDVVSASEGTTRSLNIHWAPRESGGEWRTEPIPASVGRMRWMFTAPMQVDGKFGIDLVSAGRGPGAELGWWQSPPNARSTADWKWHPLRPVGWIMSIVTVDMDGDGDLDILFSDRRPTRSGVFWLENNGSAKWPEHAVGSLGTEPMFLTITGSGDILVAVKRHEIHWHKRLTRDGRKWSVRVIPTPPTTGGVKAVSTGDLDGDGRAEIVFSCESTPPGRPGVMGLRERGGQWEAFEISGSPGVKYDLVELVDLDGDGDLDVLTCEETTNLGVVWFENPA